MHSKGGFADENSEGIEDEYVDEFFDNNPKNKKEQSTLWDHARAQDKNQSNPFYLKDESGSLEPMNMALESISVGPMQNTIASRNEEKRRKIFDIMNDDLDDDINTRHVKPQSQASVQVQSIR